MSTFFADYAAGDLTPKFGGGLVNHGATVANAPAADLAGSPRIAGSAIDIGAYECQFDPTTVLLLR